MKHFLAVVLGIGLAGLACRAGGDAGALVHPADGLPGTRAVVADEAVVLRERPLTNAGPLATLALGTAVTVEGALPERSVSGPGRVDYWYRVSVTGKRGWLPGWQLVARERERIVDAAETGQLLFFGGDGRLVRSEAYFSASLALLDYELRQEAVVNGYMRATVHGDLAAVLTFHDGHPEAEGRCLSTKVFGREGQLLFEDGEGAPRVLASARHGRIVLLPGRSREILEYGYDGVVRILGGDGKELAEFSLSPFGKRPVVWRPGEAFETLVDKSGRYFVAVVADGCCVVDLEHLKVAYDKFVTADGTSLAGWQLAEATAPAGRLELAYQAPGNAGRRQAVSRELAALFR